MAITFAVRGDSFTPRYNTGWPTYGLVGATLPTVIADAGAIGGQVLDLDQGSVANRGIHYSGYGNWPNTPAVSVLMRCKFGSLTGGLGLFNSAGSSRDNNGQCSIYISTADIRAYMRDRNGSLGINNGVVGAHGMSTGTWYDIVLTYTGDTTANGFEVFVDASSIGTLTSTRGWSNPRQPNYNDFAIALSENVRNTQMVVNEIVIWDSVITPSSVTLTSGTGSLNGASRTAFVDVAAFDATAVSPGRVVKSL